MKRLKRKSGICKVCQRKFSYKPPMPGVTRNTCDEHRPKYYGQ